MREAGDQGWSTGEERLSLHKMAPPLKIMTPQLHMLSSKPAMTVTERERERENYIP